MTTLFAASPAEAAGDKISSLLTSVRDATSRLAEAAAIAGAGTSSAAPVPNSAKEKERVDEVDRLQKVVEALRSELGI